MKIAIELPYEVMHQTYEAGFLVVTAEQNGIEGNPFVDLVIEGKTYQLNAQELAEAIYRACARQSNGEYHV